MSILVGVRKYDSIGLAGDSLHCFVLRSEGPDHLDRVSKLRQYGLFVIGMAGASIYDTLMDDYLARTKPKHELDEEVKYLRFLVGFWRFVQSEYHLIGEVPPDEESQFAQIECEFLFAGPAGLFTADADLTVMRYRKYCAVGSGARFAYGAMHAIYESELDAVKIAKRAAESAICFDPFCGGNVETIELPVK